LIDRFVVYKMQSGKGREGFEGGAHWECDWGGNEAGGGGVRRGLREEEVADGGEVPERLRLWRGYGESRTSGAQFLVTLAWLGMTETTETPFLALCHGGLVREEGTERGNPTWWRRNKI
jgi:hypothetical protein